jgi:two-component system chemotaxis response regulator CheY
VTALTQIKIFTVLIIDDCEVDLELLAHIVSDLPNVNVLKFKNSWDVINLLSNKIIDDVDLVLCDYQMPRFNGLDILIKFRSINKSTPFIFISAYMDTKLVNTCKSEGATGFIVKPYITHQLLAKIEKVMNY